MLVENGRLTRQEFWGALQMLTKKTLGAATAWELANLVKKLREQDLQRIKLTRDILLKHGAKEVGRGDIKFPEGTPVPAKCSKEISELFAVGDTYKNPVTLQKTRNGVELEYEAEVFLELEGLVKLA